MAFPTVESQTTTNFGVDATSHLANYPATVNAGDRLLLLSAFDGTPTITTPSDYTIVDVVTGADPVVGVYTKIAAGTEGGGTIDVATSASERGGVSIYRLSGTSRTVGDVAIAWSTATTSSPNPPNLAPSWGSADNLWFCACSASAGTTDSANSSGYGNRVFTGTAATTNAAIVHLRKTATASSDDPSAWTWGSSVNITAFTIAVKPAPPSLPPMNNRTFRVWNKRG